MSRVQSTDNIILVEQYLSSTPVLAKAFTLVTAATSSIPAVNALSLFHLHHGGGKKQHSSLLGVFHLYLFQFSPTPPTSQSAQRLFSCASGAKHSRSRTRLTARPLCPPATETQEMHYHVGLGGVPAHGSLPANSGTDAAADSRHIKGTDTKNVTAVSHPKSTCPIIFNVLRITLPAVCHPEVATCQQIPRLFWNKNSFTHSSTSGHKA